MTAKENKKDGGGESWLAKKAAKLLGKEDQLSTQEVAPVDVEEAGDVEGTSADNKEDKENLEELGKEKVKQLLSLAATGTVATGKFIGRMLGGAGKLAAKAIGITIGAGVEGTRKGIKAGKAGVEGVKTAATFAAENIKAIPDVVKMTGEAASKKAGEKNTEYQAWKKEKKGDFAAWKEAKKTEAGEWRDDKIEGLKASAKEAKNNRLFDAIQGLEKLSPDTLKTALAILENKGVDIESSEGADAVLLLKEGGGITPELALQILETIPAADWARTKESLFERVKPIVDLYQSAETGLKNLNERRKTAWKNFKERSMEAIQPFRIFNNYERLKKLEAMAGLDAEKASVKTNTSAQDQLAEATPEAATLDTAAASAE